MNLAQVVQTILILSFSLVNANQWNGLSQDVSRNFPTLPFSRPMDILVQRPVQRQRIPVLDCLTSPTASRFLNPQSLQELFQSKLKQEESLLIPGNPMMRNFNPDDPLNFRDIQLRSDSLNGPLIARTATKVAEEIIQQLTCDTNRTASSIVDAILKEIRLPSSLCPFHPNLNCQGLTEYRSISGICNNLQRPYEGSALTAFGRLLPPVYEDGLSRPRSLSVSGRVLPSCRFISLNMDSKPYYDVAINHHWVIYGQFIAHDITLSLPWSDSGRKARTSCTCDNLNDDRCNIILLAPNDPFMSPQHCINTEGTAQTFADPSCRLGVKEQMNANSHFLDLSTTYGSEKRVGSDIRTGQDGLMKVMRTPWSKYELPPGERLSKTCADSTPSAHCFAGGDSRIMENLVLSGIQAQWLRAHNRFAMELARIRPDWRGRDEILYQEARKILSALNQYYAYEHWLPILIGDKGARQHTVRENSLFSRYDPSIRGVVFNEVITAALRLHTFVRDSMTRCKSNGQLIDQRPLNDVLGKCRLAYDTQNNGIDSFLCGSLYDYSYAGDSNYGSQVHHRLFEKKDDKGRMQRQDILSINICRAREHGIPGYNAYREFCGLRRAENFEDFADTMSAQSIARLKSIYEHPDDVDLIVGSNHEEWAPGAVVGPVAVCLIGEQFRHLKYGDRFFYSHEGQFTPEQLVSIKNYSPSCFFCHTTDIEFVAKDSFRPPDDIKNPLQSCDRCPLFDFNPWRLS